MATLFVYLESAADTPLTGASPVFDYWDKSSPGAPVATGVAMTELVGGIGGGYFADVVVADNKEYLAVIDATASARSGARYHVISFSGTTEKRLETDIPAVLTRLPAALVGGRMDSDVAVIQAAARQLIATTLETTGTNAHGTGDWSGALNAGQVTMLTEIWQLMSADVNNPRVDKTSSIKVPADGSEIDIAVTTVGSTVTTERQP